MTRRYTVARRTNGWNVLDPQRDVVAGPYHTALKAWRVAHNLNTEARS